MEKERTPDEYNVSDEVALRAGGKIHYGVVTFSSDGHFLIPGDFHLEIDVLRNKKGEFTDAAYEFMIQTPDGSNGAANEKGEDAPPPGPVTIIIHRLKNDVCVKSLGGKGGKGGGGIPGASGGDGGDGGGDAGGGLGGNGGCGGRGKEGGKGADGPAVTITYTPVDGAQIVTLSKDDKPCEDCLSYGGAGGEGGEGGPGGKGGQGGLNGDGKNRAKDGKLGKRGKPGKGGKDGANTPIIIVRNEETES